jgi:protein O-GlcNAc transferase
MSQEQLLQQGYQLFQAGRLVEAERLFGQILAAEPVNPGANQLLGYIRAQQGRNDEALQLMGVALERDLQPASALVNYGLVLQSLGRLDEALASFDKALTLQPELAAGLTNRGALLQRLGRPQEALADLDRAAALEPNDPNTLNNRANLLGELKRLDEALENLDRAVKVAPKMALAWNNRGNILGNLGRAEEALASYAKALALNPAYVEALYNRAVALAGLYRFQEALASYDQALGLNPHYIAALYNRGGVLRDLHRHNEALICFEQILTQQPDHADAWHGRAYTLLHQERVTSLSQGCLVDALGSLDKALAINPRHVEAHSDRGFVLRELGRIEEALAAFEAAVALKSDHRMAFGGLAQAALYLGDWDLMARIGAQLKTRIAEGCIVQPLIALGYTDDGLVLRQAAQNFLHSRISLRPEQLTLGAPYRHERIRIAYVASDFGQHGTASVLVELMERHDRARFACFGISFRPDDGSALRARFANAFEELHDVSGKSHHAVAQMLADLQIDIVVDLIGYTRDAYPEIFSYRPAPVQVNFLGFPGTMGADFMDYIIGDATVLPMTAKDGLAEKIVQLPSCYLPSDTTRAIAPTPTREKAGLPETGFVFAAFSAKWKITAPIFDIWMRLLSAVPGSVLWLPQDGAGALERLRAQAVQRGIAAERLVFFPPAPISEHLARQRLADLFLDVLPYNANSSAADGLWAGVPIVTCMSQAFAGRVCASLLRAAGLAELVTHSLEDYEALALKLARDPALLRSLRKRLADNRESCALFDMDRYRRGIEAGYIRMLETAERGAKPQAFSVSDLG